MQKILNKIVINRIQHIKRIYTPYLSGFQGIRFDRVPEELWMEVCDIVQQSVIEIITKKGMQKGKMAVWGGLTNSYEKKRG